MSTRNNTVKTRGRPFAKGNAGRPKGARHKSTIIAEKIMEDDVEAVVQSVVKAAKRGDMTAAKIILDRVAPTRRGRPVAVELPSASDTAGLVAAFAALTNAVGNGDVTPEEAAAVASVLEGQRKVIETHDIAARLAALEAARSAT